MSKQITLCDTWQIPSYAQPHIHIESSTGQGIALSGNVIDHNGMTEFKPITVYWGKQNAPLTQLTLKQDTYGWGGDVRLGGFVTAIHFRYMEQLDIELAIMMMEAYPLKPTVRPYLSASDRASLPYSPPDFLDGIDDDVPEGVTMWLAEIDSPLVGLMQDAMNQGHRVYAFGHLADEEQGWHHIFALPILLEAVTTFMR
jgi:hypothetical protein